MKAVLMIARDFPPEGNAGAYRPLRFVRHLPSFGWHPTVITAQKESYERYDMALVDQVPANVAVIRVRNRDPWQKFLAKRSGQTNAKLSHASPAEVDRIIESHHGHIRSMAREVIRSVEAWVYHPDIDMGWIRPAVKAIETLCAQRPADVLWATAGPVSSFHIAQQASRRTGVPYVLDFRDAWTITFNEFEDRRPAWAKLLDHRNMYSLLKGSQAVIFRYDTEAECYWRAYHGALDASRIRLIPNGFDGEVECFTAATGERCEVLYTGTLSDYRYDTLLEAVSELKKSFPEEASRLHLHFIGEGTQAIAQQARALGLDDVITAEAAMSQSTVAKRSKEAHALLLLGRPPAMKGYELFAAAKLFGYLKAGQPILGVLPHDEARKILQRLGVLTIADVESVADIVSALRRLLRHWANSSLRSLMPDANACCLFSADRQTQILVSALEGIPAAETFVPGQVEIPNSLREEVSRREFISKRKESAISLRAEDSFSPSADPSTALTVRSHNNLN